MQVRGSAPTFSDTEEVRGSNPLAPTTECPSGPGAPGDHVRHAPLRIGSRPWPACPSCAQREPGRMQVLLESARPHSTRRRRVPSPRNARSSRRCSATWSGSPPPRSPPTPRTSTRCSRPTSRWPAHQIEAHGGVVEKFIGDAVVGVFGVPAAHEDDPERAVRAGLRICEDAEELTLGRRSTAEAPRRDQHRGGAGAPRDHRRLGRRVPRRGRDQHRLTDPVGRPRDGRGGRASAPTRPPRRSSTTPSSNPRRSRASPSRCGSSTRRARSHASAPISPAPTTPRSSVARSTSRCSRASSTRPWPPTSPQLVTVVGEPGLGKSRIVAELGGYIDTKPELITWRQGRCLPYGEGITFWALGEIVKAHAGILESDPPDVATTKLDAVLPEGDERPWFRQRLLPLLGIEATSTAEREELFTAWRRFLEHIAEQRPDRARVRGPALGRRRDARVPRAPRRSGRGRAAARGRHRSPRAVRASPRLRATACATPHPINLVAALRGGDRTPRLRAARDDRDPRRAATADPRSCRGQPPLRRGVRAAAEGQGPAGPEGRELGAARRRRGPVPRLGAGPDRRPPGHALARHEVDARRRRGDREGLLGRRDRRRWASATSPTVTETLRELSRKELVRPARRSSIEGEAEYAFWHILARDVAYGQLPRASRASRHVAAARWIESKAPERVEDLADVLAYHYATALELAQAAGQTEQASELEAPALKFLTLAGERALGLDTAAALSNLERALALTPPGHPERPEALARFGEAALQAGRYAEAAEALEEAIASFRDRGEIPAAARAMGTLANVLVRLGDPRQWTLPAEALALLEPLGPSPELVGALTEVAAVDALQGRCRGRDPRRRPGARARRGARPRLVPRAPSASGRWLAPTSEIPEASRTSARRSSSRPRPGRDARSPCSTTTSGCDALELRRPGGIPGGPPRGDRLREGPGAHRDARRAHPEHARRARRYRRARRGARARRRDGPAPGGERGRVRPHRGPRRAGPDPRPAGRGATGGRAGSTGSSPPPARPRTRSSSSSAWARPPRCAPRSAQDEAAAALLTELESYPGARDNQNYTAMLPAMVRTALGIGEPALAERLVERLRAPHPLRRARPRRGERRPHRGPRGPVRPPPTPTPMPPIAGSGSGSSPSRRSRSSARAGACSGCPDRPRPHPSCSTPARSSSGSRRPPRSPRPTRSCSRRPRSARRASRLVNTWSRSRPNPTVLPGTPVTSRTRPELREVQVRGLRLSSLTRKRSRFKSSSAHHQSRTYRWKDPASGVGDLRRGSAN